MRYIVFLVLLGVTTLSPAGYAQTKTASGAAALAAVKQRLQKLRGLRFLKPVQVHLMTRKALRTFLQHEFAREYPPAEFRKMEKTMRVFGLLQQPCDLHKLYLELLGEGVDGLYDSHHKQLYLIQLPPRTRPHSSDWLEKLWEPATGSPNQAVVMAHELTHALQDQYFDLEKLQDRVKGHDDRNLALTALIEGDATLTMLEYQLWPHSLSGREAILTRLLLRVSFWLAPFMASPKFRQAPLIIQQSLLFPYKAGLFFCINLKQDGGYNAINQAFMHPPLSTEMIIHPQKYLADFPIDFDWPQLTTTLGPRWHRIDLNVMGELGIATLLQQFTVTASAAAAAGWGGDRYAVYENNKDGALALVWLTTWDTLEDSQQFFKAYQQVLRRKYGSQTLLCQRPDYMQWKHGALQRQGQDVMIIEGLDTAKHPAILARLSASRRFTCR